VRQVRREIEERKRAARRKGDEAELALLKAFEQQFERQGWPTKASSLDRF
jgi:hypothetical protein